MTKRIVLSAEDETVCLRIRDAVKTARPKITVQQLAAKTGVTADRLSNVINGRTKPVEGHLMVALRKELNKSKDWPFESAGEFLKVSLGGIPMVPIPIVGQVSAGAGTYNVDVEDHTIYVPESLAKIGGVGFLVDGESMMPRLEPGDVAVFREHRIPRLRYTFLVKSAEGEFRVKNIGWDGDQWTLQSLNRNFGEEPLGSHELIGYLIGWYKARGTRETMDSDPSGLILD